jgi:hypothetical protein
VIEVADRLRVAAVEAEARDLLEREARTGRDQEPVVLDLLAVAGRDRARGGVDPLGGPVDEADALAGVHRLERERDVAGRADAERQPDQRRDEREVRARIQHDDLVGVIELLAELQGGRHAGEARSDDDCAKGWTGLHCAVALDESPQLGDC